MEEYREEKVQPEISIRGLKMEIRSCEELRALLAARIRVQVQDESLARQLEATLADIIAYGVGEPSDELVV
jgi:hypothetical protein